MAMARVSDVLPDRSTVVSRGVSFVVSVAGLLILWKLASVYVDDPRILPGPVAVFELMIRYSLEGDVGRGTALLHLQVTLVRVAVASIVTMGLATVLGGLTARKQSLEDGIIPWIPFWMTVPTVVVVLVTMMMFDFGEIAMYASAIIVATPFAVTNIWQGMRDVDIALVEMAVAFDADRTLVWKDIYLYHLLPFLFSSYRFVLGIVWKIVILGEVFGLDTGIGNMYRFYYTIGRVDSMLAYIVLFICVLFAIEYVVLAGLESWLFRWREDART